MIYGIGTDLIEIERIEAALARHGERFARRILGPEEMLRYLARGERVQRRGIAYLATRFAAKEAISKAFGLGMRMPMTWRSAQILNAPSGRPEVRLSGALVGFAAERALRLHISVSDERGLAIAHAIAEVIAPGS
jgi:holo-[acyl-carrier protein] synthase